MKKIISIVCLMVMATSAMAQFKDPVKWTFSATKKSAKVYELSYTAVIEKPWHLYSQTTPKGGPVPTKITYKANPLATVTGLAKETGTLKNKHEEVFGVDVKYFDGKVVFTQTVTLKAPVKTNISGTIEYMVCDDTECQPPKKIPFVLPLQ